MANIQNWLTKISSAIYGREMRSAIHDSIKKVNDDVETKEPKISPGTESQYYRGDKTFVDFGTSVRNTVLNGFSTVAKTAVTASDTVIQALGKLQAQIKQETQERKQADIKLKQDIVTNGGSSLTDRVMIKELYAMLGYVLVDGGVFGMGEPAEVIDGNFVGEPPLIIDCGGFEPRSIKTAVEYSGVMDGGTY